MSKTDVRSILARGLQSYGELAVTGERIADLIKQHSSTETVVLSGITFQRLKEAIVIHGEILEEDSAEQSVIAVIHTGYLNATCALVAVVIQNDELNFAAYAKEGLIKQRLAQKAIALIIEGLADVPR